MNDGDKVLDALNWQPKKTISQEAFDEAVRDNIDALDMTAEEAIASVVEELQMQNVDLTNIIQTAGGGDISRHPVAVALDSLEECLQAGSTDSCLAAVADVAKHLQTEDSAGVQQARAVCTRAHAVQRLLLCALARFAHAEPGAGSDAVPGPKGRCSAGGDDEQAQHSSMPDLCIAVLQLCTRLLEAEPAKDEFAKPFPSRSGDAAAPGPSGCDVALTLLRSHPVHSGRLLALGDLCVSAATRCEDGKCSLMESEFPAAALAAASSAAVAVAARISLLRALVALVTADDSRPPASKAFMHARMLAQDFGAIPVFLDVLAAAAGDADQSRQALVALQPMLANEDICKKALALGGLKTICAPLVLFPGDGNVVAAALSALRQLAKSDSAKLELVRDGIWGTLAQCMNSHQASAKVAVQVLGLLSVLMLRQPEHAEELFSHRELLDLCLDAMQTHATQPLVIRQGCQMLRNMVVRNEGLRAPLLEKGVERLLRNAKRLANCWDVASAALRDLGFDDYNT